VPKHHSPCNPTLTTWPYSNYLFLVLNDPYYLVQIYYLCQILYFTKFMKWPLLFGSLTFVLMQNIFFLKKIFSTTNPIITVYLVVHIIKWCLNICFIGGCIYSIPSISMSKASLCSVFSLTKNFSKYISIIGIKLEFLESVLIRIQKY
jgi:hypothetical protein